MNNELVSVTSQVNTEDEGDETFVDASYRGWRDEFMSDPQNRAVYEKVARQKELALQLREARLAMGYTQEQIAAKMGVRQAQVARLEKPGYASYALTSLERYVQALGGDYEVKIGIRRRGIRMRKPRRILNHS